MYTQHIKHLVSAERFTVTDSMFLHLATKLICSYENIRADEKQDGANLMDSFIGHIIGIKIWSQFHHDANVCQKVLWGNVRGLTVNEGELLHFESWKLFITWFAEFVILFTQGRTSSNGPWVNSDWNSIGTITGSGLDMAWPEKDQLVLWVTEWMN